MMRQKDAHTEDRLCRKRRKTEMEQNKYVDKLLKLTKGATSQFHTVLETKKQLEEAGFEEVALRKLGCEARRKVFYGSS